MKRRPFKWPFNTQIPSNFPATPKVELSESPPPLTQKYIDEVITALQTPPPNIGGHGQPALTTQDLLCTKCHSTGHIAEACTIEPIIKRICFYCGEPNHNVKECPYRRGSPTTAETPEKSAKTAQSATSHVTIGSTQAMTSS